MPKTNKQLSKQRENKIAKDIGGRAHVASGAFWNKKSDASNEAFQIEDKFTQQSFYILSLASLLKINKEALKDSKIPVFKFGFLGEDKEYAIINRNDYAKKEWVPAFIVNIEKKSKRFTKQFLHKCYLEAESEELIEIKFPGHSFILMTWDSFLDNMENFLI